MRKTICPILCAFGILAVWLWVTLSICAPKEPPASCYAPDIVESYTTGSFDLLQIHKVYYLTEEDTPERISTEDFQQYGRNFRLIELAKESGAGADIYTAIFMETGPAS